MPSLIVVYEEPADPERFLDHYFRTHLELARQVPGVERATAGRVSRSSGFDAWFAAVLEWPSEEAMTAGLASPEAKALGEDVANLGQKPAASLTLLDGRPPSAPSQE